MRPPPDGYNASANAFTKSASDPLPFYDSRQHTSHTRIKPMTGIRPILLIPSTQKNGTHQELPMLLGLKMSLQETPTAERQD